MSFLSKAFRRKSDGLPPWAALDQEALRISAAMEHVQDHGNLDAFPGNQNEKLALMLTASRQGLVTWNRGTERYELTSLGRERLGMRQALQESGGPMNLPPASAAPAGRWVLGSGTIMAGVAGLAIGAVAMALLPGSSSKAPPRDKAAVAAASKPADAGNPPRQVYPQAQTAAPASTQPPAPASSQPEPPKAQAPEPPKPQAPQQAAIYPGEAGAAAGVLAEQLTIAGADHAPTASAEASPAPAAPQAQPQRRTAERSRKYQGAPPAPAGPEQPGFARAAEEPSVRATERSSRSRHVATDQQKNWTESRRKNSRHRDYAEQDEGEPREGVTVRRYEEDDGPPVMMMRRHRGEPSLRRGGDEEERPGYARRESPTFGYRDREGPPRFGLFDWLFR